MGWYDGCQDLVRQLKDRYNFDYVLCGIHELDNICFCCSNSYEKCFSRLTPEQVAEKYFSQVLAAARTGLFDTIAHLAYYLRAGLDYFGPDIRDAHRPFLPETFDALIASNTAIEINTSALRHGLNGYYPPMEIINAAKKAGVEDRAKVKDALVSLQGFQGATGSISYANSHDPEKELVRITIKDGKWVVYQP